MTLISSCLQKIRENRDELKNKLLNMKVAKFAEFEHEIVSHS
jgi:hypothetical protein